MRFQSTVTLPLPSWKTHWKSGGGKDAAAVTSIVIVAIVTADAGQKSMQV